MKLKVMSNTSPIIALSSIHKFNLLYELFDVYIPQEVYNEIVLNKEDDDFGKLDLEAAVEEGKVKIYEVKDKNTVNKLYGHFHKGELETILGAMELGIKIVVIDEKSARNFAKSMLLNPIGVIGVLHRAKEIGKLNKIKPCLDGLRDNEFRISSNLYNQALKSANE